MFTSRVYFAVGAVAVGVHFLLPSVAQNLEFILVGAFALTAILLVIRRNRPNKLLPWYMIACGILMFVIGDVMWAYQEKVLGVESPLPSVTDGFYFDSARFSMDGNNVW